MVSLICFHLVAMEHLDERILVIVARFLADDVLESSWGVEKTDDHYIRWGKEGSDELVVVSFVCCRKTSKTHVIATALSSIRFSSMSMGLTETQIGMVPMRMICGDVFLDSPMSLSSSLLVVALCVGTFCFSPLWHKAVLGRLCVFASLCGQAACCRLLCLCGKAAWLLFDQPSMSHWRSSEGFLIHGGEQPCGDRSNTSALKRELRKVEHGQAVAGAQPKRLVDYSGRVVKASGGEFILVIDPIPSEFGPAELLEALRMDGTDGDLVVISIPRNITRGVSLQHGAIAFLNKRSAYTAWSKLRKVRLDRPGSFFPTTFAHATVLNIVERDDQDLAKMLGQINRSQLMKPSTPARLLPILKDQYGIWHDYRSWRDSSLGLLLWSFALVEAAESAPTASAASTTDSAPDPATLTVTEETGARGLIRDDG